VLVASSERQGSRSTNFASPQSRSLIVPFGVTITFPGLRSRCTIPPRAPRPAHRQPGLHIAAPRQAVGLSWESHLRAFSRTRTPSPRSRRHSPPLDHGWTRCSGDSAPTPPAPRRGIVASALHPRASRLAALSPRRCDRGACHAHNRPRPCRPHRSRTRLRRGRFACQGRDSFLSGIGGLYGKGARALQPSAPLSSFCVSSPVPATFP